MFRSCSFFYNDFKQYPIIQKSWHSHARTPSSQILNQQGSLRNVLFPLYQTPWRVAFWSSRFMVGKPSTLRIAEVYSTLKPISYIFWKQPISIKDTVTQLLLYWIESNASAFVQIQLSPCLVKVNSEQKDGINDYCAQRVLVRHDVQVRDLWNSSLQSQQWNSFLFQRKNDMNPIKWWLSFLSSESSFWIE